ncbi:RGS1-HXK1-interacting protein 1 isoform X1 [Cryptomeria japonica]|uniref:RGS1-HXK1-interacting protein 1 isoform X1 n=1 Tax=Cryptomeria japonica TaxID=3369 RepID=UPI0027D9DA25|nr:RGS1-HXK1-interacting protein 1 isoform X1 [Cryptomeria japonica]
MAESAADVPPAPPPYAAVVTPDANVDASSENLKSGGGEETAESRAKPWHVYTAEQAQELKQSLVESTDSALQSVRNNFGELRANSSIHYRTMLDHVPKIRNQYIVYEDAFFRKLKEGLFIARENPTTTFSVAAGLGLLLMRSPRRFLFRHTIGRFQSEESLLANAENKVKDLRQSVELLKNESKKLQERATLAEEELKRGQTKLKHAGNQIQSLVRSVYKTETQASRLMDNLREIPGREALKLRAEVASMASDAKSQRSSLVKQVSKITNHGISV